MINYLINIGLDVFGCLYCFEPFGGFQLDLKSKKKKNKENKLFGT